MRGARSAPRRDGAPGDESLDDALTVEPLDPQGDSAAHGGRLRAWLVARARAWPERLAPRTRALRVAMVAALLMATLFALLNGTALVGAGWARITNALRGAPAIPSLAMTGWRAIGLALNGSLTYTPDPRNPALVYACEASGQAVTVWQTDSAGQTWRSLLTAAVSPAPSSCRVKLALDAPSIALVVVYARDPREPGCERLTLYSGGPSDAHWRDVPLPPFQGACLGDAWPSERALYYWWTNAQGGQALTGLARSDDLGALWTQVPLFPFDPHFSLAPALLDSGSADSIITQVYTWPEPGKPVASAEVWRSLDGGFSWRRALNAPLGARLLSTTDSEALDDVLWPPTYAAVYNAGELSPPWVPDHAPASIQALNPDGTAWRPVPPLPLPSGMALESVPLGVSEALAVGPGGDLLALGQKPGSMATLNPQRELWLWAWDPAIQQWRVGMRAPDGASLAGITWANGPADSSYAGVPGAYLWLTGDAGGQQALFSTFIPGEQ